MRKTILVLMTLMPVALNAQTYDFDMTKQQPVYSDSQGYGYDVLPAPDKKKPAEPFYFSVKVPDGNYLVKVVLGGKKNSNTTVRAEGRRLMMDNITTKRAKDTQEVSFTVNKRTPLIDEKNRVKIKDREKAYFTWDDKLTLEFNGDMPAVKHIHIEKADVPTIYLCGNSTVVDQNYEPWASWGQMITRWFGPEVAISNHAESGLTARTFIASNRLDKILTTLKKGDYVFVEFGHNDEKEKKPGDGAWYHYQYQLKIFVDQVRKKGADIVFCTPPEQSDEDILRDIGLRGFQARPGTLSQGDVRTRTGRQYPLQHLWCLRGGQVCGDGYEAAEPACCAVPACRLAGLQPCAA